MCLPTPGDTDVGYIPDTRQRQLLRWRLSAILDKREDDVRGAPQVLQHVAKELYDEHVRPTTGTTQGDVMGSYDMLGLTEALDRPTPPTTEVSLH